MTKKKSKDISIAEHEVKFEIGDRVGLKNGDDLFSGVKLGIVDEVMTNNNGDTVVFVRTRHTGFGNSGSYPPSELVKCKDWKITVDEFFDEMYLWLIKKGIDAEGEHEHIYKEVRNQMSILKEHIGY